MRSTPASRRVLTSCSATVAMPPAWPVPFDASNARSDENPYTEDMDVQTLRLFREVAGGATVTETAAGAHLTQPALSRALRRLEHDAGAELFRRSGRLLRLTPAGHAFKRHVDAVLDQLDQGL